jgi:hypothetical protein
MISSQKSSPESRDTSPLGLEQLSDDELMAILYIERRLYEAQDSAVDEEPAKDTKHYLARARVRHPRVLLLDGGRGTGKTSMLLTLIHRWSRDNEIDLATYKARIERLQTNPKFTPGEHDLDIPDHVSVIGRILDFDPLPPKMPLVAGIMQAWQPLAKFYDELSRQPDDCDDEGETLMDLWQRLFQVAAVGWTAIPESKGLIEQVLDRQDQVADWHCLDQRWFEFVNEVIKRGRCLPGCHRVDPKPVFVIIIDDVDLQVGRIRELLPALRLLYHPRVVFLVAADQKHMIDMLKIDFYGQENELGRHRNAIAARAIEVADSGWPAVLATSAFEKVFPSRNRMKLDRLSLNEFLAFPEQPSDLEVSDCESDGRGFSIDLTNFKSTVKEANTRKDSLPSYSNASQLICEFAKKARQVELELPGVMTYRAAEQLRQFVEGLKETRRAAEVLARLLSGNGDTHQAVVQRSTLAIEVPITGELAALFRPGPTVLGGTYNIVLSGRPDFVFVSRSDSSLTRMSTEPDRFNFTTAMIALLLEEARFPVHAEGLQWDSYLSNAWTEWSLPPRLSFAWTRHKHPRPDQLFEQTRTWADFIKLRSELQGEEKLERYAYAWVYYQRKWSGDPAEKSALDPIKLKDNSILPWNVLLDFDNVMDKNEAKTWKSETLPLLARPEIGFPPSVQKKLMSGFRNAGASVRAGLRRARRRLVTDAFVAAGMQRHIVEKIPPNEDIENMIGAIDRDYVNQHSEGSPWRNIEEPRSRKPKPVGRSGAGKPFNKS